MINEKYVNSLSVDELRRELTRALEVQYGILFALRDLPEFPSAFILKELSTSARYPDDSNRGKELQREHGSSVIPFNHECEMGAGLWERIRNGLSATQNAG